MKKLNKKYKHDSLVKQSSEPDKPQKNLDEIKDKYKFHPSLLQLPLDR